MNAPPLLHVQQVSKHFGRVQALNAVSLVLEKGRIYGLAGENGAGKSTFVKVLSGVHRQFDGHIQLDGRSYQPANPGEAERLGISVFHQEIPVCPNLSVAANVFLGARLPGGTIFPSWKRMESWCEQRFRDWLEMDLDSRSLMGECTVAEQQLALLVRVLSRDGRLLILDEPTTALTPSEVANLFRVIRRLKSQSITFVFVSHLLDELMELCDEIFVLRDGALVGHLDRAHFDAQHLAGLIAGRTLQFTHDATSVYPGKPRLEVRKLSRAGHFRDVSFAVRPGEILGITGLDGSGRSAVVRALFARPPADAGQLLLNGAEVRLKTPGDAIRAGIGYVPEDRKNLGLFDNLDVQSNLGLLRLDFLAWHGWLSRRRLHDLTLEVQSQVQIKMSSPAAPISSLSGGNQQKVLIARWLAIMPQVLVMNDPTRGVDVGAKDEIYRLLRSLGAKGNSFVVASTDLDELLNLADRILVMSNGRIVAEFSRGHVTKQDLIRAVGVSHQSLSSVS